MTARSRWLVFAAAVLMNLLILFWPRSVGPSGVPGLDKVMHALSFGLIAWSGGRAGVPLRWLGAALALHAVESEVIQHVLLPDRSGDPADSVADVVGTLLGLVAVRAGRHGVPA